MLQQGARSLTSLYAELSQQLKHAVCPPFRVFSGLPSKTALPAPLPSQEYIDLAVVFCTVVNWGSAERESLQNKRKFYRQVLHCASTSDCKCSIAVFSSGVLQTLNAEVCICTCFGTARRFLIKVNAKYPEIRWTSPRFSSKPKLENRWLALVSFRVDKSLLRSAGLFRISPSVSGSRGRQSGRSGGLQVALNDFVKLNVCIIMPFCKKWGKMWLYSQRNVQHGYAMGFRFFSVAIISIFEHDRRPLTGWDLTSCAQVPSKEL